MTLSEFQTYLHTWLYTKLSVSGNQVQKAYQNAQLPSLPFYTFHVKRATFEQENIPNNDGTYTIIKTHIVNVCLKAHSKENYDKSMQDLQLIQYKLLSVDEIEELNAQKISIVPDKEIISLAEELQENEFIDTAYLDVIAMFEEEVTRNDIGYFENAEMLLEYQDIYNDDPINSNDAIKILNI